MLDECMVLGQLSMRELFWPTIMRSLGASLSALAVLFSTEAVEATTSLAFVGNSYTFFNDLPTMFATLAALLPMPVNVTHRQATPEASRVRVLRA